jgi:hypothetical protein
MAYRDDPEPLKAQEAALTSELSSLHVREQDVRRALEETHEEIRRKRALPMLDDVRVASPCSASWDEMVGDERVRSCDRCEKSVYNVSAMTRDEARTLLVQNEGATCLRLFRRTDGTVITSDCQAGKRRRVRRLVGAFVAATLGPAALLTMTDRLEMTGTMGAVAMTKQVRTSPPPNHIGEYDWRPRRKPHDEPTATPPSLSGQKRPQ